MKKILILILVCLFSTGNMISVEAKHRKPKPKPLSAIWEVDSSDVSSNVSGTYKKTKIAHVRGLYNGSVQDLEMKFDSAFNSLFNKYASEVFPGEIVGENVEVLARAFYGSYKVEALLTIQPDKTYILKVRSYAEKHNDKWARNLKARIDK